MYSLHNYHHHQDVILSPPHVSLCYPLVINPFPISNLSNWWSVILQLCLFQNHVQHLKMEMWNMLTRFSHHFPWKSLCSACLRPIRILVEVPWTVSSLANLCELKCFLKKSVILDLWSKYCCNAVLYKSWCS